MSVVLITVMAFIYFDLMFKMAGFVLSLVSVVLITVTAFIYFDLMFRMAGVCTWPGVCGVDNCNSIHLF